MTSPKKSFYDDPYRQLGLVIEALQWRGAPFILNGSTRGGCSCIGLLLGIHMATGALPDMALPRGTGRLGDQRAIARMSDWLQARPEHFFQGDAAAPVVGDVLLFRSDSREYHCGLYLGVVNALPRSVLHAAPRYGVSLSSLTDPTYGANVLDCYRICDRESPQPTDQNPEAQNLPTA